MHEELKIIRISGAEIQPHITDVARLRLQILQQFPYLYDGEQTKEEQYLQTFADCAHAVFVLAQDQQNIVGASIGIPLQNSLPDIQKPFIDNNYDIKDLFYFGESVLESRYRSRGIYRRFYQEREAFARTNKYGLATFCEVERQASHPQKPRDYVAMNDFWLRLGYQKHSELMSTLNWKEMQNSEQSAKTMLFWLKNLWQ